MSRLPPGIPSRLNTEYRPPGTEYTKTVITGILNYRPVGFAIGTGGQGFEVEIEEFQNITIIKVNDTSGRSSKQIRKVNPRTM